MNRLLISLIPAVLICAASYLGGFDFDERGLTAAMIFVWSAAFFVFSYVMYTDLNVKEPK